MKKKYSILLGSFAFLLCSSRVFADIIIGVAAPITGPNAAMGSQIQYGAQMAAEDINKAGGIHGEKIVLQVVDDASDARQGVSVANLLAGEGVGFVVAHFNSGVALPASIVYDENGMLAMSPGATNPQLTEAGFPLQFRICGRDDQQGIFGADYIMAHWPDARIALVHDKTAYGQGLADEVKKKLNAEGVQEISYDGVNVDDKDFSAIISKFKRDNIDVVYFGGVYRPAGLMLRQMAEQGVEAKFLGGDAMLNNELAATAGDAVDGVLTTFNADPRNDPQNAELIARFRATGFEPEAYTLYSYAIMQVFAEAITAVGEDPDAVADYIKQNGPFSTALGQVAFNENGDPVEGAFVMNVWHKDESGKYVYGPVSD